MDEDAQGRPRSGRSFADVVASDDRTPLLADIEGRSTIMVTFGGLGRGMAMPPFEFFGLTEGLDVDRIFIRDLDRGYYHRGVAGVGRSPSRIAAAMRPLIEHADRVITVGVSAGGYAALLFGSLLDVDQVVAISPGSCLRLLPRIARRDRRWWRDIERARRGSIQREMLDLKPYLAAHPVRHAEIHYATDNRLDRWHACRLRSDVVRTIAHPGSSHLLAKELRDAGDLFHLLQRAVIGSAGGPSMDTSGLRSSSDDPAPRGEGPR